MSKKSDSDPKVRQILFLLLGLERKSPSFPITKTTFASVQRVKTESLDKLDKARVCRRNILALASVVVVAKVAGADPQDLEIFGVQPSNEWGVRILGATVVLVHLYWYVLRYFHMQDQYKDTTLVISRADLLSNWAATLLTIVSWGVIGFWMFR